MFRRRHLFSNNYIVLRYVLRVAELRQTTLTIQDYAALAELRHQIRRFVRFSEEASRKTGLKPQQHQLIAADKAL